MSDSLKPAVINTPVVIGRLGAASGIKGWVKLHSFTEPVDNFLAYSQRFIKRRGGWEPLEIEDIKPLNQKGAKGFIVKLKGIEQREEAQLLTNSDIVVEQSELVDLPAEDYYWHQLIGLNVVTLSKQCLGVVDHLLETGANDVLVIRASGESIDDRERLVPWLDHVVTKVDVDQKTITVDWDAEF